MRAPKCTASPYSNRTDELRTSCLSLTQSHADDPAAFCFPVESPLPRSPFIIGSMKTESFDKRLLLLALDSFGAIAVGLITLTLTSVILSLYNWTHDFLRFIAIANICYGLYSGSLMLMFWKMNLLSRWMVLALILGNSIWSIQCILQAWILRNQVSYLGLGQLIFEGIYVGGLAYLEAKIILPSSK